MSCVRRNLKALLGMIVAILLISALFSGRLSNFAPLRSAGLSSLSSAIEADRPRFTKPALSMSTDVPGQEVSEVVSITNPSAASLSFRLSTTCGCSGVSPNSGVIPPHGSAQVRVTMKSPSVRGGRQGAAVLLIDEDGREFDRCAIETVYPSLIEITPRTLTLTADGPGEPIQREVTLTPSGQAGVAALKAATISVRHGHIDHPGALRRNGETWTMLVGTIAAPATDLSDTIEFIVGQEMIATLPVLVKVEKSVTLIPGRVTPKPVRGGYEIHLIARYDRTTPIDRVTILEFPDVPIRGEEYLTPQLRRLHFVLSRLPVSRELTLRVGANGHVSKLTIAPETLPGGNE